MNHFMNTYSKLLEVVLSFIFYCQLSYMEHCVMIVV